MSEKHQRKYTSSIKKRLTTCYIRGIVAVIIIIIAIFVTVFIYFFRD